MGELTAINGGEDTTRPEEENAELAALAESMMSEPAKRCPFCEKGILYVRTQTFPRVATESGAFRSPSEDERLEPIVLNLYCYECGEESMASDVGLDGSFMEQAAASEVEISVITGGGGQNLHVPLPDESTEGLG